MLTRHAPVPRFKSEPGAARSKLARLLLLPSSGYETDEASSRMRRLRADDWCQQPPRIVVRPSAFRALANLVGEMTPASRKRVTTGRRASACASLFALNAAVAWAVSFVKGIYPLSPSRALAFYRHVTATEATLLGAELTRRHRLLPLRDIPRRCLGEGVNRCCEKVTAAAKTPAMPRFYFHLFDGAHIIDDEGVELPNVATAREVGIESAIHVLAAEMIEKGTITLANRIEVEDEDHRTVLTLPFRSVVTVK